MKTHQWFSKFDFILDIKNANRKMVLLYFKMTLIYLTTTKALVNIL